SRNAATRTPIGSIRRDTRRRGPPRTAASAPPRTGVSGTRSPSPASATPSTIARRGGRSHATESPSSSRTAAYSTSTTLGISYASRIRAASDSAGDLVEALDQRAVAQERVDAEVVREHACARVLAQPERELAIGDHAADRLRERAEVVGI